MRDLQELFVQQTVRGQRQEAIAIYMYIRLSVLLLTFGEVGWLVKDAGCNWEASSSVHAKKQFTTGQWESDWN